jgi:hypothetical protein
MIKLFQRPDRHSGPHCSAFQHRLGTDGDRPTRTDGDPRPMPARNVSASSRDVENPGMKVIEFFSGIGGMRVSLALAGVPVDKVTAYDTSPLCNTTYRHNFPDCDVRSKLVEQLAAADVEGVDLWTMSPPW